MPEPDEIAREMFETLQPAAIQAYQQYILSRTPAELQEFMTGLVDDALPPTEFQATVVDGQNINLVRASGDVLASTTAHVNDRVLVSAEVQSNVDIVANGGDVVVHDLADAPVAGSPGVAAVVDSIFTKVNLTV